jgi:imidazole glycerol-phosphate synthase subunit HisH
MIGIINYIFRQGKIDHCLCSAPSDLDKADRFLLPGVGAFDPTMARLGHSGILEALRVQVFDSNRPVLGICVGMHLLAEGSEEGALPGLGWIKGRVRKIDTARISSPPLLPHMGWNSVALHGDNALFEGIDTAQGFYFLHSYYFDASADEDISATVDYGGKLPCAVGRGRVFGVQFHPEKSHANGIRLLRNFAELA